MRGLNHPMRRRQQLGTTAWCAVRRTLPILALAGGVACGPRPAPSEPSWIERDVNEPAHATAPPRSAASAPAIDPARIDETDEAALRAAIDALGDRAPAGKLALRLARLAHHRGDDRDARDWLDRAARAGDATEVAAAAAALAGEIVAATVDPAMIAVLLPLSGPYGGL